MRKLKIDQLKQFSAIVDKQSKLFDNYKKALKQRVPDSVKLMLNEFDQYPNDLHSQKDANNVHDRKKGLISNGTMYLSKRTLQSQAHSSSSTLKVQFKRQPQSNCQATKSMIAKNLDSGKLKSNAGAKSQLNQDDSTVGNQSSFFKQRQLNQMIHFEGSEPDAQSLIKQTDIQAINYFKKSNDRLSSQPTEKQASYSKKQCQKDIFSLRRLKSQPNVLQSPKGPSIGSIAGLHPQVQQTEVQESRKNQRRINNIISYNMDKGGSRGVTPEGSFSSQFEEALLSYDEQSNKRVQFQNEFSEERQTQTCIPEDEKEDKQKLSKKERMLKTWQKQGSYTDYTRKRFMYQTQFGAPLSQQGATLRYISIVNPELSQQRATNIILKRKQGLYQEEKQNKDIRSKLAKQRVLEAKQPQEVREYLTHTQKKLFSDRSQPQSKSNKNQVHMGVKLKQQDSPVLDRKVSLQLKSQLSNKLGVNEVQFHSSSKRLQPQQKVKFLPGDVETQNSRTNLNSSPGQRIKNEQELEDLEQNSVEYSEAMLDRLFPQQFGSQEEPQRETQETQATALGRHVGHSQCIDSKEKSLKKSGFQRQITSESKQSFNKKSKVHQQENWAMQAMARQQAGVLDMNNLMSKITQKVAHAKNGPVLTEQDKLWNFYLMEKMSGQQKNLDTSQYQELHMKDYQLKVKQEKDETEEDRQKFSNFLSNPIINVWLGERKNAVDVNNFDLKLNFFKDIAAQNVDNTRLREIFAKFLKYEEQQKRKQRQGFQRTHNLTEQDVEQELSDRHTRMNIEPTATKVDLLFRSELVRKGLTPQELAKLKSNLMYYEMEEQKTRQRELAFEKAIKDLREKNMPKKKIYDRKETLYFDIFKPNQLESDRRNLAWTKLNSDRHNHSLDKITEEVTEHLENVAEQNAREYITRMQNQVKRSQRLENYNVKKLRICNKLINFTRRMKTLKLNPKDRQMQKSFPTQAYQLKQSRKFFKLVKHDELDQVEIMIRFDPYLVFQKDHLNNTPLHWAVKRKQLKMSEYLIKHKADVNEQNMEGKAPLYYAVLENDYEMVRLLILSRSKPWFCSAEELMKMAPGKKVMQLIKAAKQIHMISSKLDTPEQREQRLLNELGHIQYHIQQIEEQEEQRRKAKEQSQEISVQQNEVVKKQKLATKAFKEL